MAKHDCVELKRNRPSFFLICEGAKNRKVFSIERLTAILYFCGPVVVVLYRVLRVPDEKLPTNNNLPFNNKKTGPI